MELFSDMFAGARGLLGFFKSRLWCNGSLRVLSPEVRSVVFYRILQPGKAGELLTFSVAL